MCTWLLCIDTRIRILSKKKIRIYLNIVPYSRILLWYIYNFQVISKIFNNFIFLNNQQFFFKKIEIKKCPQKIERIKLGQYKQHPLQEFFFSSHRHDTCFWHYKWRTMKSITSLGILNLYFEIFFHKSMT